LDWIIFWEKARLAFPGDSGKFSPMYGGQKEDGQSIQKSQKVLYK
jgi:hypothetical protein